MRRLALLLFLVTACATRERPTAKTASPGAAPLPEAPAYQPPVDDLIHAAWKSAGVTPAPAADDGEWLRRVTLDLVGRIPTPAESSAFAASTDPRKRERIVDALVTTPDYAEHWADVYSDLLIGRDIRVRFALQKDKPRAAQARGPREWLVAAFTANMPYDALVTALVTAGGDVKENGAAGYVAVHSLKGGGPETLAAQTARDFLGVSIQCAQCHDHPFNPRYKQEDFLEFAAYFALTAARFQKGPDGDKQGGTIVVVDAKNRRQEARLAKVRKKQGQNTITVAPRFLGRDVPAKDGESRRQTLARAIVGSDLFAQAAVNHTWSILFGRGIVDPWDDLGGEDDPDHPALLIALAKRFVASHYDLRALLKDIVLSDAYARSSRGDAVPATDPQPEASFARAAVRPLPADALFHSLLVASGIDKAGKGRFRDQIEDGKAKALREYLFVFGDDEMAERDSFQGSVTQALLLFNGEVTNLGTIAFPGTVLAGILDASSDRATRLAAMFLAAYGRAPTADEAKTLGAYLDARGGDKKSYEDVYFAMLTSTEFLTNH